MIKKKLKKSAILWSVVLTSMVVVLLLLGHSIVSEGVKLLFSQRILTISDLNSSSNVYQRNFAISSEYTSVDFVYDEAGKEVRFKGYINELSDGYYLVFTQQEVNKDTLFILSPVTFSQDNMSLFRQAVIAQLAEDTGLSEDEVAILIYPTIYYDHTQRIINDIPIVVFWSLLLIFTVIFTIKTSTTYLKIISRKDVKEAQIWGSDKKRVLLSSGVLQLGIRPIYVAYHDILLYEKNNDEISLKTKTIVFRIKGSPQLFDEIAKKVVPEFVVKNKIQISE